MSFGRDQGTHGPLHQAEESVGRYGREERGSAPPGSVRPSWDVDIVTEDEVQQEEAGSVGRGRPGPTHVQRVVSSRQESGFLAEMEMFASLRMAMLSPGLLQSRSCITHMWVIGSSPALGLNKESKREPGLLGGGK